jgi:tetratricopeptide (TPR) repeat protein
MLPKPPQGEAREPSDAAPRKPLARLADALRGAKARLLANRLKAGLVAGGCLLAVVGAVVAWVWLGQMGKSREATLEAATEALDRGDYGEARRMAEELRQGRLPPDAPLGAAAFLLGAAAAYEAEDPWKAEHEPLDLVAARYLEEARDLGFPPGREGEGLYLLGRSLYRSRRMAESRLVLQRALTANPRNKTEIRRLLAAAYLEDADPKLLEALEENAIYLADFTLSDEAKYEGLVQRAEILLQLGKTSECLAALDQIPPEAQNRVEAIVTRGRVLMHQARALKGAPGATDDDRRQAAEEYHAAIKTLRTAQGHDTLAAQGTRKAMYVIGLCYLELGDDRAALSQFGRTRRTYVGTPEALASDFQVAELARRLGRDKEALAGYRRTVAAVTDVKQYSNPWLPLDDLRAGLLRAYEHYRDAERFETSLELARLLYPVFSRARAVELVAETYQLWGRSLLARAEHLPLSKAEPLRRDGRAQLRRAGRTFEQLAKLRVTTAHYSDDLRDSAECYLEGQGYSSAVEVLREHLKTRPRQGQPRALANLGDALLALGRLDEALDAYVECVGLHPNDAASFHARLGAGRAYREKGDLEKAQELLQENLSGEFLTPDSNEWRDSLFCLGRTLHAAERYEEATPRLEEAVARYPESPQTIEARYLIADCYSRRANQAAGKLEEDLLPGAKQALAGQIAEFLQTALGRYRQAHDALAEREKATELSRMEKALLRDCVFGIGRTLFDLEQYDQAVKAYLLATGRYPNSPEVLEAYVQIARAYRRLNKPDEARRTVEQAKTVLDRIKGAGDFDRTTIYKAEEWQGVLDSLASL